MRLDELELVNICQHESLRWEFDRGLIGIFGPNGSGKSNSMNVACYGGLTNDYSRHQNGKPGMIRQQAGPDEQSQIRLKFSHDEHDFEIVRGLAHPVKHLMKREGQKDLTKANEIAAELEDVLGIKRRLIDDYVFVGQWELFAFLSANPSDRAKSFAHLCNTTHAELCWDLLGKQIAIDLPMAEAVVDNRDDLRQQVGEYKGRLRANKASLVEARKNLLKKTMVTAHEKTVRDYAVLTALEEELPGLEESEAMKLEAAKQTRKRFKEVEESHAELESAMEGKPVRRDEIIAELADLESKAARTKQKREQKEILQGLREKLDALGDEPDEVDEDLTPMTDRIRKIAGEQAGYLKLLEVEKTNVCPTCGTSGADLVSKITDAKHYLPKLREELEELEEKCCNITNAAHARRSWLSKNESFDQQIVTVQKVIAGIKNTGKVTKTQVTELAAERHAIEVEKEVLFDSDTALNALSNDFTVAKTRHVAAKESHEAKKQQLAGLNVTEQQNNIAITELAAHRTANNAVAGAKSAIAELESFIERKKEEIERTARLIAKRGKLKAWCDDLQDVRDEVLHRDKLPQIVHGNYLLDMEEEINETLTMFDSPFSVGATENVGFTAHFQNGTVMPAPGLSGGQKVMLAMAYRLTINSLFASQVGMMVLDEPTDGLDADNRRLAAEVFQRLGEVARARGHQVIVITHDEALERVFDQKFVLQRPI